MSQKNFLEDAICQIYHWKNLNYYNKLRHDTTKGVSLKPFDEKKIIFVHIPKTGGVSVCESLFGVRSGGHSNTNKYKKIFGLKTFYNYYKFCFVRNPYTRILSGYNYFKKGGSNKTDREVREKYVGQYNTFNEFVNKWLNENNIWKVRHFSPQTFFICNKNKNIEVDFLGKFETMKEDYNKIAEHLNIDATLPHYNMSKPNQNWQDLYTPQSLKKIEKLYKDDFEILGYSIISN